MWPACCAGGPGWSESIGTDGTSAARSYVDRYHLTFPNLIDPDGVAGNAYGLHGLPTTFILDSQGKITAVLQGPQSAESLLRALHLTSDQPDS